MAKVSGAKIEKECPVCKIKFFVYGCAAHQHTTCGIKKCQKIYRSGKGTAGYYQAFGYSHTELGHCICWCQHCKKQFFILPSRARQYKSPPKFCSPICKRAYAAHKKEVADSSKKSMRVVRDRNIHTCETCGKIVMRSPSYITRNNNGVVFCSRVCYTVSRRGRIFVYCALCGKEMNRSGRWRTAKTGMYFCSNFCRLFFNGQKLHNEKTIYTPEFIRLLIGHIGQDCPFLDCEEKRAPTTPQMNPFGLCATHARLLYNALGEKRRVRVNILTANNL